MKKILAVISSFSFDGLILGRKIADTQWLFALLRYSTLEEFHFFFSEIPLKAIFLAQLKPMLPDEGLGRVKCFDMHEIGRCMLNYDYVAIHNTAPDIQNLLALRNQLRPGKRVPITGFTHTLVNYSQAAILLQIALLGAQRFDCMICSSRAGQQVIRNALASIAQQLGDAHALKLAIALQTRIIPIGTVPIVPVSGGRTEARVALGFAQHEKIILCLGRISFLTKMDLQPVLLSFSRIARQVPDCRLVIAGGIAPDDHGCLTYIEKVCQQHGISRQTTVLPNVAEAFKPLLYAAADIFLSLSDHTQETFGITIIEAMSAGLPVVASDWDGYKDLVVNEVTGYLVPTYWTAEDFGLSHVLPMTDMPSYQLSQQLVVDLPVLEEKLVRLLNHPELARAMGAAGKQIASERFGWENIIRQYEQLWLELKQSARENVDPVNAAFALRYPITEIFSSYPSRCLGWQDYAEIRLSDYAQEALSQRHDLIITQPLLGFCNPEIINALVRGLQTPVTAAQHLAGLAEKFGQPQVAFNIQWLLKKGILELKLQS